MSLKPPRRQVAAIALALTFATSAVLIAKDGTHPRPGTTPRPLGEQPAWMRRSKETNLPDIDSRDARMVIAYCGQCHVPPPPGLRTSAEWRWMIVRMDTRAMAQPRSGFRAVSNEDLKTIAHYYARYARR